MTESFATKTEVPVTEPHLPATQSIISNEVKKYFLLNLNLNINLLEQTIVTGPLLLVPYKPSLKLVYIGSDVLLRR